MSCGALSEVLVLQRFYGKPCLFFFLIVFRDHYVSFFGRENVENAVAVLVWDGAGYFLLIGIININVLCVVDDYIVCLCI